MDVYEQQQVSEDVVPDLADAMAELEMSETEKDKKDQQNESEFFIYSLQGLRQPTLTLRV